MNSKDCAEVDLARRRLRGRTAGELCGYRIGGVMSDPERRDVRGVVEASGELLDTSELSRSAPEVGVAELLVDALQDSSRT